MEAENDIPRLEFPPKCGYGMILLDVLRFLGGGNSNIFGIFTPKIGEDEPILTSIFFRWVETTNQFCE